MKVFATAPPGPRPTLEVLPSSLKRRYLALRFRLGERCYEREEFPAAFRHFSAVARAGDAEAQCRLAQLFAHGQGVFSNPGDAAFWYREAALQGNIAAQFALSLIYLHGRESGYCIWHRSASTLNEAAAQINRDALFPNGIRVAQDYEQALRWGLLAAANGHVEAQANVGLQYLHGLGCEADHLIARNWLEKAAEAGNPEAQLGLGQIYAEGLGVPADLPKAAALYSEAAAQGNDGAQVALALMCVNGHGVARDVAKAAELFNLATRRGNVGALYNLGLLTLRGDEIEQDLPTAESCFRRAAYRQHTPSMMRLAEMYSHGLGVPQNIENAAVWYRTAADLGSVEAQYNLGVLHAQAGEALGRPGEAAEWYRRAAEQGFAPAQFNLAKCLLAGDASVQSRHAAAQWLRLAGAQGLLPAQLALAGLYLTGECPPYGADDAATLLAEAADTDDPEALFHYAAFLATGQGGTADPAAAAEYYRRAAEQGHRFAQHNLADLLLSAGDAAAAAQWFGKAADQGVPESQMALGDLYSGGQAVPRDLDIARRWYEAAARQGLDTAAARLADLGPAAAPQDLEDSARVAASQDGADICLVIWDLDDTFWIGALGEGAGIYLQRNHDIVVALARRGIVSSICARNDPAAAGKILQQRGIAGYFVFPSFGPAAKGQRILSLLEQMRLRPENTLFIDDDPAERTAVMSAVPAIQVADVSVLPNLLNDPRCKGEEDRELARLQQYRLLEKRHADRAAAGDDTVAFLRGAHIRVIIESDITAHLDEAVALLNRTDRLNFTKRRLPGDGEEARRQLLEEVRPYYVNSGLVRVVDDYEDHGYCGFFRLVGTTVLDFCFSRRVEDMGVEGWLYQRLGRPNLRVEGEVATDLFMPRDIDWITLVGRAGAGAGQPLPRIPELRLRGGYAAETIGQCLRNTADTLLAETNLHHPPIVVHAESSAQMAALLGRVPAEFSGQLSNLGYDTADLSSAFLSPARPGTVLVYAPWGDVRLPVYRHKAAGFFIPGSLDVYGDLTAVSDEQLTEWIEEAQIEPDRRDLVRRIVATLRAEYEYHPRLPVGEAAALIQALCERVPAGAHLFIILPYECVKWEGALMPRDEAIAYNAAIRAVAAGRSSVTLVAVNEAVTGPDEVQAQADHFERIVYVRLYERILEGLRGLGHDTPLDTGI